jgi:acetate kinase
MKGQIDGIGTRPRLFAKAKEGETLVDQSWPASAVADAAAALDKAVTWLQQQLGGELPSAIGHRVAHGGPDFGEPTVIDDAVLEQLERLVPLAPLHQPNNLAPIRAIRLRRPGLLQVACFDTAFHRGHAEVAQRYAIPDALHREGIRRYGFHGLSYEYIAKTLPRVAPAVAGGRVVVAHLGGGISMCAIESGRSVDSTMGFTALAGLPMGPRPGQIDPGILLYLLKANGWDAARLERFLYLGAPQGLSGVSNDSVTCRVQCAARQARGRLLRLSHPARDGALARSWAASTVSLHRWIGENAPVRNRRRRLAWLGLEFDEAADARHGPCIRSPNRALSAWVIPTDEERMIARHTHEIRSTLMTV